MGLQICLLVGALFCLAAGYPSGAPDGACDSMIPGHPQSNATGTPPFAIQLTSKKYTAGAKLPGKYDRARETKIERKCVNIFYPSVLTFVFGCSKVPSR